jgi:hypothetical protein
VNTKTRETVPDGMEFCELCSWYSTDTIEIDTGGQRRPHVCEICRSRLRDAERELEGS